MLLSFLFFWIINLLIYVFIIKTTIAKSNFTLGGPAYSHAFCQNEPSEDHKAGSLLSVILIQDLLFVVLMIRTSLYMVSFLCRQHKTVQHRHSSSLSSQSSLENKATRSILWLMNYFLFCYCSKNIMNFYGFYTVEKISRLDEINGILSSCCPTNNLPFFVMKNNKFISQFISLMRIHCPQRTLSG
jgi:vomeronasal1 receptor